MAGEARYYQVAQPCRGWVKVGIAEGAGHVGRARAAVNVYAVIDLLIGDQVHTSGGQATLVSEELGAVPVSLDIPHEPLPTAKNPPRRPAVPDFLIGEALVGISQSRALRTAARAPREQGQRMVDPAHLEKADFDSTNTACIIKDDAMVAAYAPDLAARYLRAPAGPVRSADRAALLKGGQWAPVNENFLAKHGIKNCPCCRQQGVDRPVEFSPVGGSVTARKAATVCGDHLAEGSKILDNHRRSMEPDDSEAAFSLGMGRGGWR